MMAVERGSTAMSCVKSFYDKSPTARQRTMQTHQDLKKQCINS